MTVNGSTSQQQGSAHRPLQLGAGANAGRAGAAAATALAQSPLRSPGRPPPAPMPSSLSQPPQQPAALKPKGNVAMRFLRSIGSKKDKYQVNRLLEP